MNKTLRWFVALVSASLISYTLFASLGLYISNANYDNPTPPPSIPINFIAIHKEQREPPSPLKKITPAHTNHNDTREEQTYRSKPIHVPPQSPPLSIAKHSSTNRENRITIRPHPIFRVEPIYPMFAIARNIEGWVEIEFLITESGAVVNPTVLASEPLEVFEQTALTAISQWRYLPDNKGKSSVHIKFQLHDN